MNTEIRITKKDADLYSAGYISLNAGIYRFNVCPDNLFYNDRFITIRTNNFSNKYITIRIKRNGELEIINMDESDGSQFLKVENEVIRLTFS